MQILARVPVNAMIDILFPTLGNTNFLDVRQADPYLAEAARVWVSDLLSIYEGDARLPKPSLIETRLARDTDASFVTWADALAHVHGAPMPQSSLVTWDRAELDVLLDTPIRSDRSEFSFLPRFGRLGVRVTTTLGFLPRGGGLRMFVYEGDPELFRLDPTWDQSAAHFLQLGFSHILSGTDHLLLLFCMVVLFRHFRALIPFVVAFTISNSMALIGSALKLIPDGLWFGPLVGTLMAISIVYVGLECIVNGTSAWGRQAVAVGSGLVFGCGFWFFLQPLLQYGGDHRMVSVFAFNAGIEMGQFLALALLVPAVELVFRYIVAERIGTIILAALAAHVAWHRMTERAFALSRFPIQVAAFDPTGAVSRYTVPALERPLLPERPLTQSCLETQRQAAEFLRAARAAPIEKALPRKTDARRSPRRAPPLRYRVRSRVNRLRTEAFRNPCSGRSCSGIPRRFAPYRKHHAGFRDPIK